MNIKENFYVYIYREVRTFVDWVSSNWWPTGDEAHMNFANESVCLLANNVQNEVVTITRGVENAGHPTHRLSLHCQKRFLLTL
jgi:hypothetical protein